MSRGRQPPSAVTGFDARTAVAIAPGIVVAAVLTWFAGAQGGFFPATMYPGLIVVLLLTAAVLFGRGPALARLAPPVRWSLAFGAGFVIWSFASIAWADSQGVALEAANRTLLYVAIFMVFVVWPWSSRTASIAAGAIGLGVAAVALVVLLKAAGSADPAGFLIKGRFAEPVGYPNGNAALMLTAAFPLLQLATWRDGPWPLRGLALAGAGVLVQVAILAQSRGSLIAGGAALLLYLALVPGRIRSLIAISALAIASLTGLSVLLDVWSRATESEAMIGAALDDAAGVVLWSTLGLLAVGMAWAWTDRNLRIEVDLGADARRGLRAVASGLAAAAVVVGIAVTGNPINTVEDAWDEFAEGHPSRFGESRFGSGLGSYRSEFWDAALSELGDRPLTGMGAGNFAIAYARERSRGAEEPLYPHSMPVEVVSQTGIVGALLFCGFLGSAGVAAIRVRRREGPGAAIGLAAIVAVAYWLVHAAGDWLLAIPAVTGAAFAALGLAAGLGSQPSPRPNGPGERERRSQPPEWLRPGFGAARRAAVPAITMLAAAAAVLATVPAWLSAAWIEAAQHVWRDDPKLAFERLDRARDLNPLSDAPDLVAGAIAIELGDRRRARRAFAGAAERTPESWFAHQQLGFELSLAGRDGAARRHLRRARELNPLEATTRDALAALRGGDVVPADDLRGALAARACAAVPSSPGC